MFAFSEGLGDHLSSGNAVVIVFGPIILLKIIDCGKGLLFPLTVD